MRFVLFLVTAALAVAGEYTTYLGDQYPRYVASMTTDALGNTYVVGNRSSSSGPYSAEFTLTLGIALVPNTAFYFNAIPNDVFVTKMDPSGNVLFTNVFAGKGYDSAASVAVDPAGNIYIGGYTTSIDFPVSNAFQPQPSPSGAGFIVKLSPDGKTILYSTYFGGVKGQTIINALATDASGNLYLTGNTTSSDFPHTAGLPVATPIIHTSAAFVASISAAGDKVLFAGTLGGTEPCNGHTACPADVFDTQGLAISLDSAGNVYFGGNAKLTDALPTTTGAPVLQGSGAFIGKVSAGGSGLAYLTYLDSPAVGLTLLYGLAVDAAGNAYLTGSTSNPKFPATSGALQTTLAGATNAFVAKLKPDGSALLWATYLGGAGRDVAEWIAVDAAGNPWVCGTTTSPAFPNAQGWSQGGDFLVQVNPIGTALAYSARYPFGAVDQVVALDRSLLIHTAGFGGIISTIASTAPPAPKVFGVANAAAGSLSGRIAPAEVISIQGPHIGPATPVIATPTNGFFPTSLAGVQVTIGGIAAPLLSVSDGQIEAVTPLGLTPQTAATIQITKGNVTLAAFPLWTDNTEPGVFPGVVNQDGTLNSQTNPAKANSTVLIYATGWQTSFAPLLDGQVATNADNQCGTSCFADGGNVYYGGTAPGIVAGVSQFNIQVYHVAQGGVAQSSIYVENLNATISVWVTN